MVRPTRLNYCQYLLSTPINNYTLMYFAEHPDNFSHDQINRYLAGDRLTPRMLWKYIKNDFWWRILMDTLSSMVQSLINTIPRRSQ